MSGKKLKVGFQTYDVKLVDHAIVRDGAECVADVDYYNQVIRVSTIYPKERQKEALLHESIHAIDHLFRIGLEEEEVQLLGTGLAGLIADNPGFLSLIIDEQGAATND